MQKSTLKSFQFKSLERFKFKGFNSATKKILWKLKIKSITMKQMNDKCIAVGAASQWWSNERMMVHFKLMMVKYSLMMVKCQSMMVNWVYDLILISPSLTSISPPLTSSSPSLTSIIPSLAWSKPSFAHLTIIEQLHQLHRETVIRSQNHYFQSIDSRLERGGGLPYIS